MVLQTVAEFRGETPSPTESAFRIAPEDMGTIVIFGATGDLARRKLIPAVYHLWEGGYLPRDLKVLGVSRRDLGDAEWRDMMCKGLKEHSRSGEQDSCDPFVENLYYHSLQFDDDQGFHKLAKRLDEFDGDSAHGGNRLYYLSVPPEIFDVIVKGLGEARLIYPPGGEKWSRVVIEKPFGRDLESAQALNERLQSVCTEEQIFRIDHYLGKETVQNIFSFRFGNAIFEPLFNEKYVDHVQITVSEALGMEDRGDFYDNTGALRDVVQNHALQLMCLVAMEPPATFGAKEIRDEKVKVLSSVHLPKNEDLRDWLVRGQYTESSDVKGYLSEEGVAEDSQTETYVALKLYIDNWRWAGVPFFIRHGKRLKERRTEICIQFNRPPTHYFKNLGIQTPEANTLVFRIQPDEAISLKFAAKPPGMEFTIQSVEMDFNYGHVFQKDMPDAYERLILDAIRGDSTLFTRADEIENAWNIVTEILEIWQGDVPPPELYRPGTWGPSVADRLFAACQGCWRT